MPIYEIGYYSDEKYPRYYLKHEKSFTKDEFDNLVAEVFAKMYKKRVKRYPIVTIECIIEQAIKELIDKHGFSSIEIEHSFIPYGWGNLACSDWEEDKIGKEFNLILTKINNKK